MITLGLDLAAQDERTAACRVEWSSSRAILRELVVGVSDEVALRMMRAADWSAIDSPFGWPQAFVEAVHAHARREGWPEAAPRRLRFRATDLAVHEATGVWPLSVSSDRIAVPAWRCARLLDRIAERSLDRLGEDRVVEVYPAGALRMWGLASRGYKRRGGAGHRLASDEARRALVEELSMKAGWLQTSERNRSLLTGNDDAFDALVCALVARAAALALTTRPEPEQLAAARVEGWIHLPVPGSLERLVDLNR